MRTAADARAAGRAMFAFSEPMAAAEREIKAFLFTHLYRCAEVNRMRAESRQDRARAVCAPMPSARRRRRRSGRRGLRVVGPERASADYVAGMTDRFALNEYRRLFDPAARLG